MKFRMFAGAIIGLAALAACATAEGYRQEMDTWVGRTGDDLIVRWGAPGTKTPLSDGREVWSYAKTTENRTESYYSDESREVKRVVTDKDGVKRTETITETYPVLHPATTTRSSCETRFVLAARVIQQVTFQGDACVAEER